MAVGAAAPATDTSFVVSMPRSMPPAHHEPASTPFIGLSLVSQIRTALATRYTHGRLLGMRVRTNDSVVRRSTVVFRGSSSTPRQLTLNSNLVICAPGAMSRGTTDPSRGLSNPRAPDSLVDAFRCSLRLVVVEVLIGT